MNGLLEKLLTLPELRELAAEVHKTRCCAAVTGLSPVHRAMVAAALAEETKRPLLLLCADEKECARQAADVQVLLGVEPVRLPERELQLRPASYSRQWENARLSALYRMAQGDAPVVVATPAAMVQRCLPRETLLHAAFSLEVGGQYDVAALCSRLIAGGYTRTEQVEGAGQFALRGGILDVFSPGEERPLRCEFFDDELDSMGEFETATQRRVLNRQRAHILPAGELLPFAGETTAADAAERMEEAAGRLKKEHAAARQRLLDDAELLRQGIVPPGADRYMAAVYPDKTTAFDYLGADCVICANEAGRVQEALRGFLFQTRQDVTAAVEGGVMAGAFGELTLTETELERTLERFALCQLESLPTSRYLLPPRLLLDIGAKQLAGYGGSLDTAATDITHYLTAGYGVLVLCGGAVRCRNMQEFLQRRHIPAALALDGSAVPQAGQVLIAVGALSAGSEWPALKLAVLTEGQLTRALSGKTKKPRPPKSDSRQRLLSYADLEVGDLVVHVHHGIGRFVGMLRLPVDGVEKDYIKIQYAGSDCLYVPATSLDLVSKYIGGGEETAEKARLNKLSGDQWAKTTRRAKAAAKELAEGLIKLYAQRQRLGGFAFSPDSPWQQEFEDAFDYTETEDQLAAIRDIKADMEKPVPMDRLLCGDVGYGKTEVALRAAMKCILDGKQAAILVPTTVLAQQHYATAAARFRAFPVTVEVLSRFRSPRQVKDILERTRDGRVDLLIGTHKLLSKNVQFKDLGLLIIDEEQRFGVTHKEKLRERVRQVDTLTLSATPIPRTLNMALSGIRDMSTIEEPPRDRQPVQTYVLEHDWGILAEAIRRELSRGGQVYYLHNRVDNIEACAAHVSQMVPGARVGIAHGKMTEEELNPVWQHLLNGEIDILVCTTLIETGIDVRNCNTLIIEDADRMGLAQLYQIRGRVGRSGRKAYAYFTFRRDKTLTDIAQKRLSAIREFTAFGSGFRIAMRDLQIRGAGSLLGHSQHGHMEAVGYDLYVKMLGQAIARARGEPVQRDKSDCLVDLRVDAFIPEKYIPDGAGRIEAYKRIAAIQTPEDAADVLDELIDRYGDPPPSVSDLVNVSLVRVQAAAVGVYEVTQKKDTLVLNLETLDLAMIRGLLQAFNGRVTAGAGTKPYLSVVLQPDEKPLELLQSILKAMDAILNNKEPNQ